MPDLHNVSKNFLVVNCMGVMFYLLLTLTLIWIHLKFITASNYYLSDGWSIWFLFLFVVWLSYYLTLVTMATRHAGQVCSGYFLPNKRLIRPAVEPPYIKDNGLFLWYAMVGQVLFFVTFATGAASYIKS